MTNCTHHKMSASLSIYNACILFCDCLKITKKITHNTQIAYKHKHHIYDRYHKLNNFSRGGYILELTSFKISTLSWFVFLVFNTLQQKQGAYFLLRSNIITATDVISESLLCPNAFYEVRLTFFSLMQYIDEFHF